MTLNDRTFPKDLHPHYFPKKFQLFQISVLFFAYPFEVKA